MPTSLSGASTIAPSTPTAHRGGHVRLDYRVNQQFRARRGGIPPQIVGGWAGLSQVQLSRIEHGPAIKHLDRLVAWAETLRIPEYLLWFKLPGRGVEAARLSPPADIPDPADLATLLGGLTATRPALADSHGPTLGILAFEGMTLAQSADLLLRLFLALDDELGGRQPVPAALALRDPDGGQR